MLELGESKAGNEEEVKVRMAGWGCCWIWRSGRWWVLLGGEREEGWWREREREEWESERKGVDDKNSWRTKVRKEEWEVLVEDEEDEEEEEKALTSEREESLMWFQTSSMDFGHGHGLSLPRDAAIYASLS